MNWRSTPPRNMLAQAERQRPATDGLHPLSRMYLPMRRPVCAIAAGRMAEHYGSILKRSIASPTPPVGSRNPAAEVQQRGLRIEGHRMDEVRRGEREREGQDRQLPAERKRAFVHCEQFITSLTISSRSRRTETRTA
jgi:hypothetical protein